MSPDSTLENTQSREGGTGRGALNTLLQRNPLVALGAAFLGPILGLFKTRRNVGPTEIERLKLETYRARPYGSPAAPTRRSTQAEGYQKASRRIPDGGRRHRKTGLERVGLSHAVCAGKGGN